MFCLSRLQEDVVLACSQTSADALLQQLQALYGKYKFMESHLVQQQKGLLVKIPDISNALQALHHLMKKDDTVSCHFELADSIFANANIKKENTVLLWLGANVMLEYNYEEADALLTKNLKVRWRCAAALHFAALCLPQLTAALSPCCLCVCAVCVSECGGEFVFIGG